MKTYYWIVLLALTGVAWAQPQAPITWGEARLLMDASNEVDALYPNGLAQGDTIILLGLDDSPESGLLAMIAISGDNGETWSNWHTFEGGAYPSGGCWPVITGGAVYASAETATGIQGLYRTTDLGNSWTNPQSTRSLLSYCVSQRDTIYCLYYQENDFSVTWTANGGGTFAPGRRVEPYGLNPSLAVSSETVHTTVAGGSAGLLYSRAPAVSGPFETPYDLNPELPLTHHAHLEFDANGVGMVGSIVFYTPHQPTYGALYLNITRDHGTNWSAADTIVVGESVSVSEWPRIRHCGPLWAIAWIDSTVVPPFNDSGFWVRFSANWGRSWYPKQQVNQDPYRWGAATTMDVCPEYIRLYGTGVLVDDDWGMFYYQWEGQIHADTVAPEIQEARQLADPLMGDSIVEFRATATDNDSLWQMQVVLRRRNSEDSLVIRLTESAESQYSGLWQLPQDTMEWYYYYRAEDMWENVSYYPPQGPADPWVVYVGIPDQVDPYNLIPWQFHLSAYPNPFNATTTLIFSLSRTSPVSLTVFNLLGQAVYQADLGMLNAGDHRQLFDARELPSGVYLARVQAGEVSQMRKMVLLR